MPRRNTSILPLLVALIWCHELTALSAQLDASIPEPWQPLNGGGFWGPEAPYSPDPLVRYRWATGVNSSQLQIYTISPVSVTTQQPFSFQNLQSLVAGNTTYATVLANGAFIVDFGVESAGWIEFESPDLGDPAAAGVTMTVSEYNQPLPPLALVDTNSPTPVPVRYGQTSYRLELNPELYEGVRFGFMWVSNCTRPWHITAFRLVCQIKPTNYSGSFDSSDEVLNRVWWTGAYTVKLNLESNYFGAVLIDRGDRFAWTGDCHVSQGVSMVAFANYPFVRLSLNNTAGQSNGIESYSLYWILSLYDYYRFTNDSATVLGYVSLIEQKLEHAVSILGTNPELGFFGGDERLGSYFENPSQPECQRAYEMLTIRTLVESSDVLGQLGQSGLAVKYNQTASSLITALRQTPQWWTVFGMHSFAEAVNAGFTTPDEQAAMMAQYLNPVTLNSYAPFNNFFLLLSLTKMLRNDLALGLVHRSWGGMLQLGGISSLYTFDPFAALTCLIATTFWEVFDPEWLNVMAHPNDPPPNGVNGYCSLCHPWASGASRWLTDNVLGLRATSPGFATYDFAPYLDMDSLTYVSGSLLTPHGNLSASLDLRTGAMYVLAPRDTVGSLQIPTLGRRILAIYEQASGLVFSSESNQVRYPFAAIEATDVHLRLNGLLEGEYFFRIKFEEREILRRLTPDARTQSNDTFYAALYLGVDLITQGLWKASYGSLGYILFNCHQPGQHVVSLPQFVTSINYQVPVEDTCCYVAHNITWTANTTDFRALQDPSSAAGTNCVGALATWLNATTFALGETFHVDVNVAPSNTAWYRVSLYFVDFDMQDRESMIQIYDGVGKQTVAPWQAISSFGGGQYLSFAYNSSIRFRVNFVRGTADSVLSALFFDPYPPNP